MESISQVKHFVEHFRTTDVDIATICIIPFTFVSPTQADVFLWLQLHDVFHENSVVVSVMFLRDAKLYKRLMIHYTLL